MSSEGPAAWAGPMPRVGDVAERTHVVGPDFIRLFTDISGDRNPLHYARPRRAPDASDRRGGRSRARRG